MCSPCLPQGSGPVITDWVSYLQYYTATIAVALDVAVHIYCKIYCQGYSVCHDMTGDDNTIVILQPWEKKKYSSEMVDFFI